MSQKVTLSWITHGRGITVDDDKDDDKDDEYWSCDCACKLCA